MNMLSYKFKRSLYSPTGLVDLGTRLVTTIGPTVSSDPNGEQVTTQLKGVLDNLVVAIEREKSNPVTSLIRDKDAARENNLRMISYMIMANCHNEKSSEMRKAAYTLLKVYRLHGTNIFRKGNADQSSAIRYLIDCLLNDDNRARCEQLGLVPVIETLAESQDDLEALYAERSRVAAKLKKVTISNLKQKTANAIRAFLGFVDVLVAAEGDSSVKLRAHTEHILREVEALARSHRTRMYNGEENLPEAQLNEAA